MDGEWAIIGPLIPSAKRGGDNCTIDEQAVVNGIVYILSSFRNLDDLNAQFRESLDQVASVRTNVTIGRVVAHHFAAERPALHR